MMNNGVQTNSRAFDANGPMLAALVARDGGCVVGGVAEASYLIPDEPEAILAAMQADADVVLVSGGSSVGLEDYAPRLLAEHGELAIHGIAMRPSSPTGMGRLGEPHRSRVRACGRALSALRASAAAVFGPHHTPTRRWRARSLHIAAGTGRRR